MNLFVLSADPYFAARYHCDKHVVKMILETAQLLSTAHHQHGSTIPGMTKKTHVNHPCAVWTRSCTGNYWWVSTLLYELCNEYTRRYNKTHAYYELSRSLLNVPRSMRNAEREPFVQVVPEKYKSNSPVRAYRAYYRGEKARFAKWRPPSTIPDWWK